MSTTASCCPPPADVTAATGFRIALAGNPNSGKTTLFNALTGLRAKTSNYPGTTVEHRQGHFPLAGADIVVVDLPGIYDVKASSEEEQVALNILTGERFDTVIVVADATNLRRSLFLTSQVMDMKRPVIVALNMFDLAEAAEIRIDVAALARAQWSRSSRARDAGSRSYAPQFAACRPHRRRRWQRATPAMGAGSKAGTRGRTRLPAGASSKPGTPPTSGPNASITC